MTRIIRRGHTGRYRQDQAFGRPFRLNKTSMQSRELVYWLPTLAPNYGSNTVRNFADTRVTIPDGTLTGVDAGWKTEGQLGQMFDAANTAEVTTAYIELGSGLADLGLLPTNAPWTISIWGTTRGIAGSNNADTLLNIGTSGTRPFILFCFDNNALEPYTFGSEADTPYARMRPNAGGNFEVFAGLNAPFNIIITYNGNGATTLGNFASYFNGNTQTLALNSSGYPSTNHYNYIGRNTAVIYSWHGLIGDTRFYHRELSPSEAYQIYAPSTRWDLYEPIPRAFPVLLPEVTPTPAVRRPSKHTYRQDQAFGRPFRLNKHSPQAKGLVGWWPTLPISGNVLHDRSGYGYDGVFLGGVTDPAWITSNSRGAALEYDSDQNDYVNTGSLLSKRLNKTVTILAWIKPYRTSWASDRDYLFGTRYWADDDFSFEINDPSGKFRIVWGPSVWLLSTVAAIPNQWQQVGFVYDGTLASNNFSIYFNGVFDSKGGTYIADLTDGVDNFLIGSVANNTALWGAISDVRVYDRALTASEWMHQYAPSTRWDLYEPIPRVFPVSLFEAPAIVIGPFPTFL